MPEDARISWLAVATFVLSAAWFPSFGQTRHSPGQAQPAARSIQKRFAQAVDLTSHQGLQAKLPPHICTLLGLAQEQECPVMQGVVRSGTMVQGIDVLVEKNDVVLFVVDETANDQTLYLTSPQGRLRRVVSVKAGEGERSPITDNDKKAFEKEKQFWVDRLVPAAP